MSRVILTGATASGKGAVAHELALRLGAEVVSMDSMKVFREMDVGTAKPSPERRAEVAYHLIDVADPRDEFSVGEYLRLALKAVGEIEARGRAVVFCGGTSLYLLALTGGLFRGPEADWGLRRALREEAQSGGLAALHRRLEAEDPAAAARIHPHDERRIIRALEVHRLTGRSLTDLWAGPSLRLEEGSYLLAGLWWDREVLYRRIEARVERMVGEGLFEEARRLRERPGGLGRSAAQCIGYKEIFAGDAAGQTPGEIVAAIQQRTRRFAKEQHTWFRRFSIHWLPAAGKSTTELAAVVQKLTVDS
jgi:tRNA dimethylallyltransferase